MKCVTAAESIYRIKFVLCLVVPRVDRSCSFVIAVFSISIVLIYLYFLCNYQVRSNVLEYVTVKIALPLTRLYGLSLTRLYGLSIGTANR